MMRPFTLIFTPKRVGTVFFRLVVLVLFMIIATYHFNIFNLKSLLSEEHKFAILVETKSYSSLKFDGYSSESLKIGEENGCNFPSLDPNDRDIMNFYKHLPPFECDPDPNWVKFHSGKFYIKDSAVKRHGEIACDLIPIVRVADSDFKTTEGSVLKDVKNNTEVASDFFRVKCRAKDDKSYMNFHASIAKQNIEPTKNKSQSSLSLNVIMLGMDSTSHLAWIRHLPKTRKLFLDKLKGIEMWGYNILGDGTPAAIMPILIGKREEELPEARRGYSGAKPVDQFPWIWKEFKNKGYATLWGEDDAALGTFTYRLLGFKKQPVDHYYRPFSIAIEKEYKSFRPFCLGSEARHKSVFNYVKEMFDSYPKDVPKWAFTFQSELSHKDNNHLSRQDQDLVDHLTYLDTNGHLNNTLLILMADHGARFSKVRATEQGKLEERLPYMGFYFPEWFHEKYPEAIKNLKANAKRLTTPFDIHETLHEVLSYTGSGPADISKRGVSLFKEIPKERSCKDAEVDSHWCACLNWKAIDKNSEIAVKTAHAVVALFNNITKDQREKCAKLELDTLISISELKVKDEVLKFKDTADGGRGRFGKMTDTTKHSSYLYQVTLKTKPGGGTFEVTVTYKVKEKSLEVDKKDISRTNVYGSDASCVEYDHPSLRQFCYCKFHN